MANQVRIEYDPYQQKASYQIRDSSNRKFAKIPKSDLGNPDNLEYHDGMLDEILKYAIPELQEKRLAKELVFCGTEDDFQDFKDALVRFYERNPDTTWNMTLLRDETSYYRAADTVKSEINAIFQGIVDTLTEKQNEDVYRDVCRKLESYTDAVSNEIPVCVIGVVLYDKSTTILQKTEGERAVRFFLPHFILWHAMRVLRCLFQTTMQQRLKLRAAA